MLFTSLFIYILFSDETYTEMPSIDHDYCKSAHTSTSSVSTQTDDSTDEFIKAQVRNHFINVIQKDDSSVRYFTGLPNLAVLLGIFSMVQNLLQGCKLNYWKGEKSTKEGNQKNKKDTKKRKLTMYEEFVLTLVRIRLGLGVETMGFIFGVSPSLVSQVFSTWTNLLYRILKPCIVWPSRETVKAHLPKNFRRKYPKTRIVIDGTEFFIQVPRNTRAQAKTYSTYKHHNTVKALLGVNPNGAFTFVSNLWSGNTSDRHITTHS